MRHQGLLEVGLGLERVWISQNIEQRVRFDLVLATVERERSLRDCIGSEVHAAIHRHGLEVRVA